MFFQINVTPKEKKLMQPIAKNEVVNYSLLLAPFQPPTRIKLDTQINTPIERALTITNSNNRCLTVSVIKIPPEERCISFNTTEWCIQPNTSVILNINWKPRESGTWRDILQLSDSRHIKYDVPLILTCTNPNKVINYKEGRKIKQRNPLRKMNNISSSKKYNVTNQKFDVSSNNNYNAPKLQPTLKRSRSGVTKLLDKENVSNNIDFNWMMEQAKAKKQKKENPSPPTVLDFSKFLETSSFKFTPIKSKFTCFDSSRINNSTEFCTNEDTINNQSLLKSESCLTMINETQTTLRKETYIKVPRYSNSQIGSPESDTNDENHDEFDDSLSPKPLEKETNKQSEISMLLNNIKFTPFKTTNLKNNDKIKFSPNRCSTAHKTNRSNSFSDDSVNFSASKNTTFDVSLSNSCKDSTFDLPVSPTTTKHSFQFKPTCLADTFEKQNIDIEFSTPCPITNNISKLSDHIRLSNQFSKSQVDLGSARDCLEADLWVKSNTSLSPLSKNIMHSTLDNVKDDKYLNNLMENYKKKSQTVKTFCIEISPPKKFINKSSIRKVSPTNNSKIIKEKCIIETVNFKKKTRINKSIKNSIPGVRIAKLSFAGLGKDKNDNKSVKKQPKEVSVKLHDPNDFLTVFCNPDPFAATMTHDPFLSSTLYYDERWILIQELEFKKWLNALLTPPEHLTTDIESAPIDIGKVWQSCRAKEDIALAETKESISARYHTNTRLNTLRKAACVMFHKTEVIAVLSQTTISIEKEILLIRSDKDLHRDIGLQKIILELFISYNPLWLRIGLETIYGETIPLQSNNDLIGLSRFLINRFFSDPYLVKTHSSHSHPNIRHSTFQAVMNKFILKKFLFFVYFVDYAKRNKLIGHDPCLFHKKALIKESRSILLAFSRELLSGIGDITKVLRNSNYIVLHKQTYLDEYDYALVNLRADLRDGVRLCRVMELITGKRCLTCQCRVPAISRLQKVHNVNVALNTLNKAGYIITGDIDAKSIADGHKEKTLSLLWQIIYKFQAPRFENAAKTLQRWWRSKLWYVYIKNILRNRRRNAASVIQKAWKCYLARRELQILKEEYARELQKKTEAISKIQLYWRLKREAKEIQKNYQRTKASIIKIQRWWKRIYSTKPYVNEFKKKQQIVISIQKRWRAKCLMKYERNNYLKLKAGTVKIQNLWRARCLAKQTLKDYQCKRTAIIFVQNKWRTNLLARSERIIYLRKLSAIKFIQLSWKNYLISKRHRSHFIALKNSVRLIEKLWILRKTVSEERKLFLLQRRNATIIQRAWRHYRVTKKDVQLYKNKKKSCLKIQSWWRFAVALKKYKNQRENCIKIQKWWRNVILSRKERSNYLKIRNSAIIFQKNWKMKLMINDYKCKKVSVLKIQLWYKNIIASRVIRDEYVKLKVAVRIVEVRWLARLIGRGIKVQYSATRSTLIAFQRRWRAQIIMKRARQEYLQLKNCVVKIQSWWRMIEEKGRYRELIKRNASAMVLQRRWRALKSGKEAREMYIRRRYFIIFIQRKYRANCLVKLERRKLKKLRESAITIQKFWRSYKAMTDYKRKKQAAIIIQRWRRLSIDARNARHKFLNLRSNVIKIQSQWRMHRQLRKYAREREAAITIQRQWRKYELLKVERQIKEFQRQSDAALKIQRYWRSICKMRACKIQYCERKDAVIVLQRRYRARKLALQVRNDCRNRVLAIVRIQKWWKCILRKRQLELLKVKEKLAVTLIENWWIDASKERCVRIAERIKFDRMCRAAIKIQAVWRGYKVRLMASKRMAMLRERAKKAAEAAVPSATLAFRLQENIEIFKNASNIGQLSICLASLDIITRLSPNACINVCQLNLVSKLYDILTRANRSLPWLDVCLKDISILLTLAKFKPTTAYVFKEEYIEVLVRLLTISADKKDDLFLHTATLIWVLIENTKYAEAVQNCSRTKYLLSSLYTSINRKLTRITPNVPKIKGDTLPSPKPDWGLRHKRPRIFNSVSQAITSIASRLNILNILPTPNLQRSFNFSI